MEYTEFEFICMHMLAVIYEVVTTSVSDWTLNSISEKELYVCSLVFQKDVATSKFNEFYKYGKS